MITYLLYIHSSENEALLARGGKRATAAAGVVARRGEREVQSQGLSDPSQLLPAEQDLVDRLLANLTARDSAPLPPISLQEAAAAPPPTESSLAIASEGGVQSLIQAVPRSADVQALIQCAGSTRREAVDALKRASARGHGAGALQVDLNHSTQARKCTNCPPLYTHCRMQ